MNRAIAALLVVFAGCNEFTLPAWEPARPARVTSISPAQAWVGETLVVKGSDLGDLATTRVLLGEVSTPVLSISEAGDELTLAVPESLPPLVPVQPKVITPRGESTLPDDPAQRAQATFRSRGMGHPKGLSVTASLSLGPALDHGAVLGDRAFLLDYTHRLLFAIDAAAGASLARPLRTDPGPYMVVGTDQHPYVYSLGAVGLPPTLRSYDFSGATPAEDCPALTASPALPLPTSGEGLYRPAASPSGQVFTVPKGDNSVLVVTVGCPPTTRTVVLAAAGWEVVWAQPGSDTTLVALVRDAADPTAQKFVRADLSSDHVDLSEAAPLASETLAKADRRPALDPSSNRLAYVRWTGDIGVLTWPDQGAPVVDGAYAYTFAIPFRLAWSQSGDRLLAADSSDNVVAFDSTAGYQPVGSSVVPGLQWMEPMEGDRVFAISLGATTVLSRSAVVLRNGPVGLGPSARGPFPGQIGAGLSVARTLTGDPSGPQVWQEELAVATAADLVWLQTEPLGNVDAKAASRGVDGAVGSGERVLAWSGSASWTAKWPGPDPASERSARSAVIAAAVDDASPAVAVVTRDDSGAQALELLGSAEAPLPLADGPVALAWRRGVLAVASGRGPAIQLARYTAAGGALAASAEPVVLGDEGARVIGLWSTDGLGGLVLAVGNPIAEDSRETLEFSTLILFGDDRSRRETAAVGALAVPLAFSADGRAYLAVDAETPNRVPTMNLGLLSADPAGGLAIEFLGHQELPTRPGYAACSATGDRFWVTLPASDELVELR